MCSSRAVGADVDDPVAADVADPDLRIEEPERAVVVADVVRLVAARRHRGELVRVAEHHDLRTAERLGTAPARLPQRPVDRIHEVGVHHGDLVDDERVDRVEDLAGRVGLVDLASCDQADRQAEQRVDRLPLDVECGDAGGGAHGDLLRGVPREVLQQRRLAGARAAGDEHVLARVLDEPEECLLLGRERRCVHRFMLTSGCRGTGHAASGGGQMVAHGSAPRSCHRALPQARFLDWGRGPGGDGHGGAARARRRRRPGAAGIRVVVRAWRSTWLCSESSACC